MTWILALLLFDLPDLDFDLVHAGAQGHGGYPDGLLDSWFVVLHLTVFQYILTLIFNKSLVNFLFTFN